MIYDCFPFFNELELLDIRLNILNDIVDRFVIVEAKKTHSNDDKFLFFDENKSMFDKFSNKIMHIIVDDFPEWNGDPWVYEKFQRAAIMRGLEKCENDDIIIISDLDEIPKPNMLKKIVDKKTNNKIFVFKSILYRYYLNYEVINAGDWILGPRLVNYNTIKRVGLESIRFYESVFGGRNKDVVYLENAGWHWGYLGGAERIHYKMISFAHSKPYRHSVLNKDNSNKYIKESENKEYKIINMDDKYHDFPKYILDNSTKFDKLIVEPNNWKF